MNIKPDKLESSHHSENANRNKSIPLSLSRHINDVISSSTEDDDDNRQIRARENGNMIANKNAANIRKGSLSSNISKGSTADNQQMSLQVSQTKSISKHTAGHNLNTRNVITSQRPASAIQVGLDNVSHGISKVGGSNSLTNSPRSSSLSNRKKSTGVTRTSSANFPSSPAKTRVDYKSRSKTPEKIGKGDLRDGPKGRVEADPKLSNYTASEGNIGDDESCSGRSSRCDETEDGEDLSSAEAEENKPTGDLNNRRNYRRIQNRKPRNSRKKSIQSPEILNKSNRNSSASRTNTYSQNTNGTQKVSNSASSKVDSGKMLSTPSRKINKKMSSSDIATSKYAPEKYASDSSKAESLHSSPRSSNMISSKRSVSSSGSAASIYKRPNTARPTPSQKFGSSSNTASLPKTRPGSAAIMSHSMSSKRPRSNTLTGSLINDKSLRNSSSSSEISSLRKTQQELQETKIRSENSGGTQVAATMIQKQWRGHATRNNDPKVVELKEEVRNLRTEQHIRHLTKELSAAKCALEQERKLRALQMDAIKVLWKEVQMLDASKYENYANAAANGGNNSNANNRARPSGSNGSKISSRSSEHSIAKLMETLEATAGAGSLLKNNITPTTTIGIPGSSSTLSLSTPATGNITGYITTPSSSDSPVPKNNQYIMAQSMPANVLTSQLGPNEQQTPQALDTLNKTCSSLQNQVEQLQSSLTGVMQFMSAFSSLDVSEMAGNKNRTRHSSSTSTQETLSFAYHNSSMMSASMINPSSSEQTSCVNKSMNLSTNPPDNLNEASQQISVTAISQGTESADTITVQSNLLKSEAEVIVHDQSAKDYDTNHESGFNESTPVNTNVTDRLPKHHLKVEDIFQRQAEGSEKVEGSSVTTNKSKDVNRPKSPRPKTLPGLNKNGKDNGVPGLAQLAGNALLNSPQAPQQVKAFAKTLVEGLITDTMAVKEGIELSTDMGDTLDVSGGALETGDECVTTGCDDTTDISFSLATETENPNVES